MMQLWRLALKHNSRCKCPKGRTPLCVLHVYLIISLALLVDGRVVSPRHVWDFCLKPPRSFALRSLKMVPVALTVTDLPSPQKLWDAGDSFRVPKTEQLHKCLWIWRLSAPVLTNVKHLLFAESRLCLPPGFRGLHHKEPLLQFGSICSGESLGSWTYSKAVHQSVMFSRKLYFAAVSTKEFKAALAEDQNLGYLVLYWLHKGLQHGLN